MCGSHDGDPTALVQITPSESETPRLARDGNTNEVKEIVIIFFFITIR